MDKTGYILYRINGKANRLHKYLYEQTHGKALNGFVVMHICDTPSCINIEHLKLGTQKENVQDCINKSRKWIPDGIKNPKAKLTEEQVIEIREDKRKQIDIARDYGVSQVNVSSIKRRDSWSTIA